MQSEQKQLINKDNHNIEDIGKEFYNIFGHTTVLMNQYSSLIIEKKKFDIKVQNEEKGISEDEANIIKEEEELKAKKAGLNTKKSILKENKNQQNNLRKKEEELRKQIHDTWNLGHDLLDKLSTRFSKDFDILKIAGESKSYIYLENSIDSIPIIPKEEVLDVEKNTCDVPSRTQYKCALLEILYDSPGGKLILSKGSPNIYEKIEDIFNLCPLKYGPVPSGTEEITWHNEVRWARDDLVKEGLLEPTIVSGNGMYQISGEGRSYVENHIRKCNRDCKNCRMMHR